MPNIYSHKKLVTIARLSSKEKNIDEMINEGVEKAKQNNYIQKDDIIVIAGGASILSCHDGATTNRTIGGVLKI